MLGKPEWFTYRSMGWGITPKSWQGWVYALVFISLVLFLISLPVPDNTKNVVIGIVVGLFALDAISIWARLGEHHDERQRLHQLIIERNCSVAAVLSIVAVILYRSLEAKGTAGAGPLPFDPLLGGVLGAMAVTKLASTIYLKLKM
jgi:hypothetical protein